MLNRKVSFYIGLQDKQGKALSLDSSGIKSVLQANGFDGYTLTYTIGLWKGQSEPSCVVTLLGHSDTLKWPLVAHLAKQFAKAANQESVLYCIETVSADFVGGD
jgi:hypothetical protein